MKISDSKLDSPDRPPVFFVSIIIFATFLFVFFFWFISEAFLNKYTDKKQAQVEEGMGNKDLVAYINKETEYLNSDKTFEDGTKKIPINEAMEKLIEKENK